MPRSSRLFLTCLCVAAGLQSSAALAAAPRESVLIGLRSDRAPRPAATSRAARLASLRRVALTSEASVLARLTTAGAPGDADAAHAFWIAPMIAAEVTPTLRAELARRADVLWIRDNGVVRLSARARRAWAAAVPVWSPRAVAGVDEAARVYGLTGRGVKICVLDTGVDVFHPDLAGKMVTRNPDDVNFPGGWAAFDINGSQQSPSPPYDSDGHGTHVSGIAVGGATSGPAIGVAPDASLMAGLVLPGGEGRQAQIIGGMEWALDPDGDPLTDDGADIVNMSFGTVDTVGAFVAPLRTMHDLGVVTVAAAGNASQSLSAPANVPDCIGVGASTADDSVASFSARGLVTWNHPPYVGTFSKPDLVAPGADIYSSLPDGEYAVESGTSQASPFVAGVAALMRQANPQLTPDSTRALATASAVDIGSPGADLSSGAGRIDAYAAVTEAFSGRPWLDGVVRDAVTAAPIAAAAIVITSGGETVAIRSHADGSFRFRPPSSAVSYTISAYGYPAISVTTTLPIDQKQSLSIALVPGVTALLSGRVADALTLGGVPATVQALFAGLVAASVQTDASGGFSLTVPVGVDSVRVVPAAPYDTTAIAVTVPSAGLAGVVLELTRRELLVVNASDVPDYGDLYAAAFAATGRRVALTRVRPSLATLQAYGKVVWFTGDATVNTFSPDDQSAFETFLSTGGHALVLGKGIAREFVVNPFLSRVLRATAAADVAAPASVSGAPGDPTFSGYSATVVPVPGGPAERPSALTPVAPAGTTLVYGGSGSASGASAGIAADLGLANFGARLIFCGFGLEELPALTDQTALLDRALDWLEPAPMIDGTPLSDSDDDTATLPVAVTVRASSTPLDTASVRLLYHAGTGSDITLAMGRALDGSFRAAIPPQPLGTTLHYRVSAADIAGRTAAWPAGTDAAGQPATYVVHVAADSLAPLVTHRPLYQTNDTPGPYLLGFHARDERGLAGASVLWRWHSVAAWTETVALGAGADSFVATIPGPGLVGDTLFYQLRAIDASRRANVTLLPNGSYYTLRVVGAFSWDFESDDGGFAVSGLDWRWGTPQSTATIAGYAVCPHSGSRVWATSLRSGYSSDASSALELPALHLPADVAAASLRFWHCYGFDGIPPSLLDGGTVQISADDGATYTTLLPADGYDGDIAQSTPGVGGQYGFGGDRPIWRQTAMSLVAFAGRTVRIRFREGAHLGGSGSGWFLDDVRVEWAARDSTPPAIGAVLAPVSSPDTLAGRIVDAVAGDGESVLASVVLRYSFDGWRTAIAAACTPHGGPGGVRGIIRATGRGTRASWYLLATDGAGNQRRFPGGDSTRTYSVFPSAPVVEWRPVAPGGGAVSGELICSGPAGRGAPCNLEALPCPLAADDPLAPGADIWDEARIGTLPGSLLAEYRVVLIDGRATGTTRALAVLDSLAAADSLRAPGVFIDVPAFRAPSTSDSAAYQFVSRNTGAVQGRGDAAHTVTWCATDSLLPAGLTGQATAGAASLVPSSTSRPLLRTCTTLADTAAFWVAGRRDFPRVVASCLPPGAFDTTTRASLLGPVLVWLRGPARVVLPPLPHTEDTVGPYRIRVLAWSPAGIDTSSLALALYPGSSPGLPANVTLRPGPGFDSYTAEIPGQPVGRTIALTVQGRDGSGVALAPVRASFRVLVDSLPPSLWLPLTPSVLPSQPPTVWVAAADSGTGLDSVAVSWQWRPAGASGWSALATTPCRPAGEPRRASYVATLPAQAVGSRLRVRVRAVDRARSRNSSLAPADGGWHDFGVMPSASFLAVADSDDVAPVSALAESLSARASEADLWITGATTPLSQVPLTEYAHLLIEAGRHFTENDAHAVRDALANADGPHVFLLDLPADPDSGAAWSLAAESFGAVPGRTALVTGASGLPGVGAPGGRGQVNSAQLFFDGPFNGTLRDAGVPLTTLLPASSSATAMVVTRTADAAWLPLAITARPRASMVTLASVAGANVWAGWVRTGPVTFTPSLDRLFLGLDSLIARATPHFSRLRVQLARGNPGRAPVALRLEVPGGEGDQPVTTVEVFDVRGRRVRRLWDAPLLAGLRALAWDGAAEDGRHVTPGVYWVRAASQGTAASSPVVLLGR